MPDSILSKLRALALSPAHNMIGTIHGQGEPPHVLSLCKNERQILWVFPMYGVGMARNASDISKKGVKSEFHNQQNSERVKKDNMGWSGLEKFGNLTTYEYQQTKD